MPHRGADVTGASGLTRRGLQAALAFLGVLVITLGLLTVTTGAANMPDAGHVSASLDNQVRFFAVWFIASGVLALRAAASPEHATGLVRGLCIALAAGGLARLWSMVTVGAPHPLFVANMAAELLIPAILVPWQSVVASTPKSRS